MFRCSTPVEATRTYLWARQTTVTDGLPSERVIFSSLLLLVGLAAVPFGSIEPWWEGIFESAIFMLGACWIVASIIGKRWHVPDVVMPLIGFIVLASLQTLPLWHSNLSSELLPGASRTVSVDPFKTKRFVIELLAITLTLAMLLRYTSNRKQLLVLSNLVIVVGAASAAFAIWRRLLPVSALASLGSNKLQGESFGQFINRNHFAVLMEMSLGVALGLASYAGHGFRRYLYAAAAFLVCVALVLANSRGGIISMLGQIGFLAWIYFSRVFGGPFVVHYARGQYCGTKLFRHRSRMLALRGVLILLLLSAALSSVLWLGGEPVRHRLESVPDEFQTQRADIENRSPRRLEIWGATWRLIEEHPWLGSGFGAYKTAITKYFQASNDWQPQQAHNEYLELAAGGGVIGVALGIWFVLILIRDARSRLHETDAFRRAVCLGALVGLVGVAIHSLVDFGLHVPVNALICCGLVTLATTKLQSARVESQSLAT
jgi:O-antigen ligase